MMKVRESEGRMDRGHTLNIKKERKRFESRGENGKWSVGREGGVGRRGMVKGGSRG